MITSNAVFVEFISCGAAGQVRDKALRSHILAFTSQNVR